MSRHERKPEPPPTKEERTALALVIQALTPLDQDGVRRVLKTAATFNGIDPSLRPQHKTCRTRGREDPAKQIARMAKSLDQASRMSAAAEGLGPLEGMKAILNAGVEIQAGRDVDEVIAEIKELSMASTLATAAEARAKSPEPDPCPAPGCGMFSLVRWCHKHGSFEVTETNLAMQGHVDSIYASAKANAKATGDHIGESVRKVRENFLANLKEAADNAAALRAATGTPVADLKAEFDRIRNTPPELPPGKERPSVMSNPTLINPTEDELRKPFTYDAALAHAREARGDKEAGVTATEYAAAKKDDLARTDRTGLSNGQECQAALERANEHRKGERAAERRLERARVADEIDRMPPTNLLDAAEGGHLDQVSLGSAPPGSDVS